jgi:hypothetical protein
MLKGMTAISRILLDRYSRSRSSKRLINNGKDRLQASPVYRDIRFLINHKPSGCLEQPHLSNHPDGDRAATSPPNIDKVQAMFNNLHPLRDNHKSIRSSLLCSNKIEEHHLGLWPLNSLARITMHLSNHKRYRNPLLNPKMPTLQ